MQKKQFTFEQVARTASKLAPAVLAELQAQGDRWPGVEKIEAHLRDVYSTSIENSRMTDDNVKTLAQQISLRAVVGI